MDEGVGRDRLIAAAWEVLGRTGFSGFKVASVLRAAGASTTTFYRHFESKDRLLVELLRDESRRGAARIERLVASAQGPREAVDAWIAATMSAAAAPRLRARARLFAGLSEHIDGHRDAFVEIRNWLIRPLVVAIEDGVRTGDFASTDPLDDALCVQGLCRAAMDDLLAGIDSNEPGEVIARVQRFAQRALSDHSLAS